MSLEESIKCTEESIIQAFRAKQTGIDDRTGKGTAIEEIVEQQLLLPHLPPHFRCSKGAVVTAAEPNKQSDAIDRVIYDPSSASPLIYEKAHSIFPIESVCGLVEITMSLDTRKLKEDILRMAPVKAMTTRRYLMPDPNSNIKVLPVEKNYLSPRSFVIGLPADTSWKPKTIAQALRNIQLEIGPPTHVHGLYVLGIGLFETESTEATDKHTYRIKAWTGPERLFRFSSLLRQALDRWSPMLPLWTADLQYYVHGQSEILADENQT